MTTPPDSWWYGDPKPRLTGRWRLRRSWKTWFTGRGIVEVEVSTKLTHMANKQDKLHKISWRDALPGELGSLSDPPASLNPVFA